MKNINKTTRTKVAKVLSAIDLNSKYSWAIRNTNINTARPNLRQIRLAI